MMTILFICLLWVGVLMAMGALFMGVVKLTERIDSPLVMLFSGAVGIVLFGLLLFIGVEGSVRIGHATEPRFVQGIVIRRVHIPTSTTFIMSGKVMVPIVNPERWELIVQEVGGERTKSIGVGHSVFQATDIGAIIPAP